MKLRNTAMMIVAGSLLVGACAAPTPYAVYPAGPGPYAVYPAAPGPVAVQQAEYGVVESIDMYSDSSTPTGLGAVLGGVAGGVIGHQFGSGRGNTASTIAGAVGGALVGNEVEKSRPQDRYRILVRLDSGGSVAFSEVGEGALRVGDRVRVVNNRVYRM